MELGLGGNAILSVQQMSKDCVHKRTREEVDLLGTTKLVGGIIFADSPNGTNSL